MPARALKGRAQLNKIPSFARHGHGCQLLGRLSIPRLPVMGGSAAPERTGAERRQPHRSDVQSQPQEAVPPQLQSGVHSQPQETTQSQLARDSGCSGKSALVDYPGLLVGPKITRLSAPRCVAIAVSGAAAAHRGGRDGPTPLLWPSRLMLWVGRVHHNERQCMLPVVSHDSQVDATLVEKLQVHNVFLTMLLTSTCTCTFTFFFIPHFLDVTDENKKNCPTTK